MSTVKEPVPFPVEKNFDLPSIPLVLTKIIQLLDDDRASAQALEDLILHDPPLSARILKLANSALYSFRSDVKTISHAIALLGVNLVKSLAIGVHIFGSFTKGLKKESRHINQLWIHSFSTGLLAQHIWASKTSSKEGDFAFLCGLLHDLGKVAFFKKDPVGYSELFAAEKGENDPDICTLEIEHYEVDHPTLGAALAKQWGLPSELAAAIRLHHDKVSGGEPLVAAISMADMLVKSAGIGWDGDARMSIDIQALQARLKMTPEEFEALRDSLSDKLKGVEDFFQIVRPA